MNEISEIPVRTREVPDLAYEVASIAVEKSGIDKDSVLTPANNIEFLDLLESSIDPVALGERNMWLRKRGIMKEAIWYAGQITMNPVLLETAWTQESQRIRRRTHALSGSIALRYSL
jgi:hypothetical protein